jgi:hypothetical protein
VSCVLLYVVMLQCSKYVRCNTIQRNMKKEKNSIAHEWKLYCIEHTILYVRIDDELESTLCIEVTEEQDDN